MTAISSKYAPRENNEELEMESFLLFPGNSTGLMGVHFLLFLLAFVTVLKEDCLFDRKCRSFCAKPVNFVTVYSSDGSSPTTNK